MIQTQQSPEMTIVMNAGGKPYKIRTNLIVAMKISRKLLHKIYKYLNALTISEAFSQ